MRNESQLTAERARELLSYDALTGELTWKRPRGRGRKRAGSIYRHGYRQVTIDGYRYRSARVCWLIHYGRLPTGLVDHRNRVRTDDRIANLREATKSENAINSGLDPRNKSGFRGVSRTRGGRWYSCISVRGKRLNLGLHTTVEEAARAYAAAAAKHFGEFALAS